MLLSFKKIVRISMDLSVFSLAFVNSTVTFDEASINLKLKVFFMLLSAIIILLSVAMLQVTFSLVDILDYQTDRVHTNLIMMKT